MSIDETIDCRGMQCPAPILHLAKAARRAAGAPTVLEVLADDADFPSDLAAWCRTSKARVLDLNETGELITARIALNHDERAAVAPAELGEGASDERPKATHATAAARPLRAATPRTPQRAPARAEMRAHRDDSSAAIALEEPAAVTEVIDCRGLRCPAPILAISKAARQYSGHPALLEIWADDPDFAGDLVAWCKTAKADIHQRYDEDGVCRVLVGINGAAAPGDDRLNPRHHLAAKRTTSGVLPAATPKDTTSQGAAPGSQRPREGASLPAPAPVVLDLLGQRAPQPILALSTVLVERPGAHVTVKADDPTFMSDVMAWATATRVTLRSLRQDPSAGVTIVELTLGEPREPAPPPPTSSSAAPLSAVVLGESAANAVAPLPDEAATGVRAWAQENRCTILVIKNDFESLMAAMMCATTAAAQGMEVVMFFSFWGVNLLRGERPRRGVAKGRTSFLQRMMKWMMPKGPKRQKMSKMHMGGMGKGLMQLFMRRNNVMTLDQLMDVAVEQRIRFVVCSMSMGIMGIHKRDIVDLPNIEFAGVTSFVEQASRSRMSLVF